MAKKKKIKKPVYIPKEERRKQNPMPRKTKIIIGSICGALVLALILFVLLYDDGSLPVKGGVVQKGGDNWLVTNLNKQNRFTYFKQAEVNAPENFANNPDNSLKSDANETAFWFEPLEGEDTPVSNFYVSGNSQNVTELAESVHLSFPQYYGEENVSELLVGPVGQNIGQYFTVYFEDEIPVEDEEDHEDEEAEETLADEEPSEADEEAPVEADADAVDVTAGTEAPEEEQAVEEEAAPEEEAAEEESAGEEAEDEDEAAEEVQETRTERSIQLIAYFPAIRNSSIIFAMTVDIEEGAEIPTMDELLTLAAPLASGIEVYIPEK